MENEETTDTFGSKSIGEADIPKIMVVGGVVYKWDEEKNDWVEMTTSPVARP